MSFRREAKQTFQKITSLFLERWSDPFRHVHEDSDRPRATRSLQLFSNDFDELTEMLAEAQKYGPGFGEGRYQALRVSLDRRYKDLRPFLMAYMSQDSLSSSQSIDAFRSVWAAPTLTHFVELHDVFFEDRVGHAQDALRYYNEHLEKLDGAA